MVAAPRVPRTLSSKALSFPANHIAGATTEGCPTKAACPLFPSWPYPPSVLERDALAHLWLDTAESDGDAARVRLCGELDITTVDDLARWVELLRLDSRERLVIDLSAVSFCDAAGLSVLTTLHRTLCSEGRRLTLHDVPIAVRRIMAITGDDRNLDIT